MNYAFFNYENWRWKHNIHIFIKSNKKEKNFFKEMTQIILEFLI